MKTQIAIAKQHQNSISINTIWFWTLAIIFTVLVSNPLYAQTNQTNTEIEVKGMVSDEAGPLTGVNIALEGSNVGAITDTDGTFIFPQKLKEGDVLVFSYLGYQTEKIKIKADSAFINLQMTSEYIDIVGALSTNKPYKSKRSN